MMKGDSFSAKLLQRMTNGDSPVMAVDQRMTKGGTPVTKLDRPLDTQDTLPEPGETWPASRDRRLSLSSPRPRSCHYKIDVTSSRRSRVSSRVLNFFKSSCESESLRTEASSRLVVNWYS